MKRRNFILIGTAGIAATALPAAFYFLRKIEYDPKLADPQSISLIWDNQTIAAVGNHYRIQAPGEESERTLIKLLSAGNPDHRRADVEAIETQIIQDFEAGNTVIVDGWILSLTEARQCALFSIIETK